MDWLSLQRRNNSTAFAELNREKCKKNVRISKCGWCGEAFIKTANRENYCSDKCREDARSQQSRNKSHRWYHRHKHELSEKQRWGLGSGTLGQHRHKDFQKEHLTVKRELSRLRIRSNYIKKK